MFADLHLHSIYSDGTDTPDELVSLAKDSEIKTISISDHDTIAAYENFSWRASEIRIIPAIEISTVLDHSYLNILGYYIDISSDELRGYIEKASCEKTENTRINFENARKKGGFHFGWERVIELYKDQPRISGVHVVQAMQHDNYAIEDMSLWDMFYKYFRAESPDFIPTETSTAYDAIDVIGNAGGISVVAHPKSAGDDEVIKDLIRYGVQGLEAYHPIHTQAERIKYKQMALAKNLFISGGTDWHGGNNGTEITHFGMCGLDNDEYPILRAGNS